MNEETWERVGLLIAKRLAELQELAEFYGIDSLHVSIPGSNLVTRKAEAFYVTDKLGKVDTKSVEVWDRLIATHGSVPHYYRTKIEVAYLIKLK